MPPNPRREDRSGGAEEGGEEGGGEFLEGAVAEVDFGEGADADAAEAEDAEVEGGHQAADVAVAAFAEDEAEGRRCAVARRWVGEDGQGAEVFAAVGDAAEDLAALGRGGKAVEPDTVFFFGVVGGVP